MNKVEFEQAIKPRYLNETAYVDPMHGPRYIIRVMEPLDAHDTSVGPSRNAPMARTVCEVSDVTSDLAFQRLLDAYQQGQ